MKYSLEFTERTVHSALVHQTQRSDHRQGEGQEEGEEEREAEGEEAVGLGIVR